MDNTKTFQLNKIWGEILFYTAGLVLVYLTPVLSHLFAIPLYYLEPMRIIVIISLVYTGRFNSYILALTLPVFSYLVSGHPLFFKAGIMTGELLLNIFIFDLLSYKIKNIFIVTFLSIILSKMLYYLFKYIFISTNLLHGTLVSTPIIIQLILTVVLACLIFYILNKKQYKSN